MNSKKSCKNQLNTHQGYFHKIAIGVVLCLPVFLLNAQPLPANTQGNLTNNGSADIRPPVICAKQPLLVSRLNSHTVINTVADAMEGVCEPQVWGRASNVVRVGHLFFSEQPDAVTLNIADEKGLSLVINLRDPAEFKWNERSAVKAAGLDYYNIPLFTQDNSFNPLAIKQISTLVQQHQDDKILVHCSSGNRAAAWLAIYLVTEQNVDQQIAIEWAKKAGLTNTAMEAKVKGYLDQLARQ